MYSNNYGESSLILNELPTKRGKRVSVSESEYGMANYDNSWTGKTVKINRAITSGTRLVVGSIPYSSRRQRFATEPEEKNYRLARLFRTEYFTAPSRSASSSVRLSRNNEKAASEIGCLRQLEISTENLLKNWRIKLSRISPGSPKPTQAISSNTVKNILFEIDLTVDYYRFYWCYDHTNKINIHNTRLLLDWVKDLKRF